MFSLCYVFQEHFPGFKQDLPVHAFSLCLYIYSLFQFILSPGVCHDDMFCLSIVTTGWLIGWYLISVVVGKDLFC